MMSAAFRSGHVYARALPSRDGEEIWRARTAWHFQVTDLHLTASSEAHLYDLGDVVLTDVTHPSESFTRERPLIRRDGADSLLCSLQVDGCAPISVDGVQVGGDLGRLTFSDLARPLARVGGPGRILCAELRRDALQTYLPDPGALLHTPHTIWRVFLADYLRRLQAVQHEITASTAGHLGRSLLELVAACAGAPDARERARPTADHFARDRLIARIDGMLADPDLSPEHLCQSLHISRSTLYRLVQGSGGVSALIRERRLLMAFRLLTRPDRHGSISAVAFATGFRSDAVFSRSFRQRFGMAPRDARTQGRQR